MYTKAEALDFIKTYGALILAVYAIIQVWFMAIWKKFIWTGKITIFETGVVETGFSAFGPTIGLNGTLRAQRKDVFVHEISLSLHRESDEAAYRLEWTAFKSPQIKIGDPMAMTVELPAGINVRIEQPFRYYIVFCDRQIQFQINRHLGLVLNEWKQFVVQKQAQIQQALRKPGANEDIIIEQLFSEFVNSSTTVKSALSFHESTNWWQSGRYRVKFEVRAAAPDKTFSEEWVFLMEQEYCDGLRTNTLATLREICLGKVEYYSASVAYIKEII